MTRAIGMSSKIGVGDDASSLDGVLSHGNKLPLARHSFTTDIHEYWQGDEHVPPSNLGRLATSQQGARRIARSLLGNEIGGQRREGSR